MEIGMVESTGINWYSYHLEYQLSAGTSWDQFKPPAGNWYQFNPVKWTGFNMEIGIVESTGTENQLIACWFFSSDYQSTDNQ